MKKLLSSTLLLGVAILSFIPLLIWGIIEHILHTFIKKKFWKALGVFGEILLLFATIIDVFLNVILQVPMNRLLIKDNHEYKIEQIELYKFGNRKDTISRVLGIAERDGNLTKGGDFLVRFLNLIEKDHCKKSI